MGPDKLMKRSETIARGMTAGVRTGRRTVAKGAVATAGTVAAYATPIATRVARGQTAGSPPPPPPPPPGQRCGRSQGFWSTHPEVIISETDLTAGTFLTAGGAFGAASAGPLAANGVDGNATTLQAALDAAGGGVNELLRHGTAALLNSLAWPFEETPGYPMNTAQVISAFIGALADPTNAATGIAATAAMFQSIEHGGPGGIQCPLP